MIRIIYESRIIQIKLFLAKWTILTLLIINSLTELLCLCICGKHTLRLPYNLTSSCNFDSLRTQHYCFSCIIHSNTPLPNCRFWEPHGIRFRSKSLCGIFGHHRLNRDWNSRRIFYFLY